jgi:hypothetical protein
VLILCREDERLALPNWPALSKLGPSGAWELGNFTPGKHHQTLSRQIPADSSRDKGKEGKGVEVQATSKFLEFLFDMFYCMICHFQAIPWTIVTPPEWLELCWSHRQLYQQTMNFMQLPIPLIVLSTLKVCM